MGAYYSKSAYAEALKVANELNREVLDIMGPNNAVHASCLNNIGLMQKMLGNKEAALEKYKASLDIYEEVVGKSHTSYVSTSANIGVLYKSMADSAESEEDYLKYLGLAEDILKKSLAARIDLHGQCNYTAHPYIHVFNILMTSNSYWTTNIVLTLIDSYFMIVKGPTAKEVLINQNHLANILRSK